MKVLTCSRQFPKGHPKAGQPTYFVEKILRDLSIPNYWARFQEWNEDKPMEILHEFSRTFYYPVQGSKHHTIRAGSRFKPGDMVSLRVWSEKPYRSKQIEFAQVGVKKVWPVNVHVVGKELLWQLPGVGSGAFTSLSEGLTIIARNDGLEVQDFIDWFAIHPKKREQKFTGQIICWNESVEYK